MNSKLLESYRLRKRLEKLEHIVYERSMGRGGAPSIAMNMWTFLMDNGPSTREEIDAGLGPRYSNNPTINSYLKANLITKQGDRYVANPDYNWDDVGVIARNIPSDIKQMFQNMSNTGEPSIEEPVRSARQPQAPRSRRRAVKPNIFSKKVEEVQAALDEGVTVDVRDAKERTPIEVACRAAKGDTGAVIKLLLDHGADPNTACPIKPAVYYTVIYNNKEGTLALANAGADLAIVGKNDTLLNNIIYSGLFSEKEIAGMITEDFMKNFLDRHFGLANLLATGCGKFNNPELFLDRLISTAYKVTDKPEVIDEYLSVGIASKHWYMVASALERNGRAIKLDTHSKYLTNQITKDSKIADKIYTLVEKVGNGIIKTTNLASYCIAAIEICNKYNKPVKVLENLLTQNIFNEFSSEQQWKVLLLAISEASTTSGTNSTLIKCISKLKFSRPKGDIELYRIISAYELLIMQTYNKVPNQVTRLVCKKIKPYVDLMDNEEIRAIANMHDRLFIAEMIDAGLGEELAGCLSMSKECRQELEKAGISNIGERRDSTRADLIKDVVRRIRSDSMNQATRQLIDKDPEILSDKRIQDALNDPSNIDSVTATLLKRQYAQWAASAEKPKYDM